MLCGVQCFMEDSPHTWLWWHADIPTLPTPFRPHPSTPLSLRFVLLEGENEKWYLRLRSTRQAESMAGPMCLAPSQVSY